MPTKVLITGGTGSLGKALLERMAPGSAYNLTVYSRDEVKQSELRPNYPGVRFMLGDVRDYDRLMLAMRGQDVVIHTAAYKQVPSAEANVDEAIATNVQGSLNVARAAVHSDVRYVVGVSTDKAVQPVNAYGETKALMEKLFQQADAWSPTTFNCVRYGNVLGSRGSVVPLFRKQLANGCCTITDPFMTRFWMTLDSAVELVLAGCSTNDAVIDGAVLVRPCLASDMLTLLAAVNKVWGDGSGNLPPYTVIGTRAGEKLHEQLIQTNESLHTMRPNATLPYYQVMPASGGLIVDAKPFEYRSDTAPQLSVDELADMLYTDV